MRIAIVQYGVLHERFEALRSGGDETYYAQRYSVDFVAELAKRHEFVGVCGMLGEKSDDVRLTDSLHSACTPLRNGAMDAPAIIALLEKWRPERLILQAPERAVLRWALKKRIDTLPLLADSFEQKSLRHRYRAFRLARLLANPKIRAVGNHNVPSCLSLRRIGVPAGKIYPWDWPHALRPEGHPVKSLGRGSIQLVFVGSLSSSKGVGECIGAAKILHDEGVDFQMNLIGSGSFSEEAAELIARQGLSDRVMLRGRLSHDGVVEALKSATVSLAPSWHDYPEGLPMTIYEALATRTPLALSDHPMFQLYFQNTPAARMAPEKDARALAGAIKALINDPQTYAEASEATGALWNRVKCDLAWGKLINAWLGENGADLGAIREYGLEQKLATMKQAEAKNVQPG